MTQDYLFMLSLNNYFVKIFGYFKGILRFHFWYILNQNLVRFQIKYPYCITEKMNSAHHIRTILQRNQMILKISQFALAGHFLQTNHHKQSHHKILTPLPP